MKLENMIEDIYDYIVSDKKRCPICKSFVRLYTPFGDPLRYNAQCPVCHSLERHRALWMYLEREYGAIEHLINISILHFAPEKVFSRLFSKNENIDYYPVDFNSQYPGIREAVDITQIPYEDNKFDIIICNHVIEHIPMEQIALNEMRRVLKPTGVAFINAPIHEQLEFTLEKKEYNTPELRHKYYGQHDHVRKYGRDYKSRLEKSGFKVEEILFSSELSEELMKLNGLKKNEPIFKCTK